eukprot:gene8303-11234_t
MTNKVSAADALSKLDSVLNKIESNGAPQVYITKQSGNNEESIDSNKQDIKSIYWYQFVDPSTGLHYYHNYGTQKTQWEKPEEGIIMNETPPAPSVSTSTSSTQGDDYKFVASFNKKNGSFNMSGTGSYWNQVGRPEDKQGRQLSAFIDLEELEKNRQEYKLMKETKIQNNIDWSKVKQDKIKDKKRKLNSWLYET